MVLLRIQADADLPLAQVQPGMDFMTDLDRQLPECVPFPNSPSINAQNIWCAHWTVVRSNRSTSGISRFVSYLWIQLAVLNFQNRSQQGTGSKFHQLEFKSIRFRTDGLDFTEIVTRQPLKGFRKTLEIDTSQDVNKSQCTCLGCDKFSSFSVRFRRFIVPNG